MNQGRAPRFVITSAAMPMPAGSKVAVVAHVKTAAVRVRRILGRQMRVSGRAQRERGGRRLETCPNRRRAGAKAT